MDDLLAKLKAALDEAEQDADDFHHVDCENVRDRGFPLPCTCDEPVRRQRMVAAHRKILDAHAPTWEIVEWPHAADDSGKNWVCPSCRPTEPTEWLPNANELPEGFVPSYVLAPCTTLLALAEGYGIEA